MGRRNESAKYWLSVLNEIKNRGVEDIASRICGWIDRIRGCDSCSIPQAEIKGVLCIRFVILKFISYKDLKPFYGGFKAGLQS